MRDGRQVRLAVALGAALSGGPAFADCAEAPSPVLGLDFQSRYNRQNGTLSEIDPETADDASDALRPVDDFLRDLTKMANEARETASSEMADCALRQMAVWAAAGALAEMGSETAQLTSGARLAGFALVLLQVAPLAREGDALHEVEAWLTRRLTDQIAFWEEEAPPGARRGNLRAWAALAAAATAHQTGDLALRYWAGWSVSRVLCTAAVDGSLPQEMRRGRLALQYQLHAVSPLVVAALLLEQQGMPVTGVCDAALDRAVGFVLDDLGTGEMTRAITGEVQSFFDGSDKIENFHIAWVEAYAALATAAHRDRAGALAADRRPLRYSKLGGNQTMLWQANP